MPKIEAATVVEHHQMRRDALIGAAAELLAREGVEAVTLAAVGSAAGLARSSVYQYFDSSGAVLAAVVEAAIPRAGASMATAVESAATPEAKVLAWVSAYLVAVTDPAHRALAGLGGLNLPTECQDRIDALHAAQAAPLVSALTDLGADDAHLTAALIEGVARAGAERINAGASPERVHRRTTHFVRAALG
jgi:AcrR family transcriptional regulator